MKENVSWDIKQSNAAVVRWIAADALKELVLLVKALGRIRLISAKSQIGQLVK